MKYLLLSLLLCGCAEKPEIKGSWLSITKPPIHIVYVNKADAITPDVVQRLVGEAKLVPYKDYKFNEAVLISGNFAAHQSSDLDNTSSFTGSVSKSE